ncbi:MAG: hypothetical protein WCJ09_25010, partial [Planctomycetota bacterium]
MPAAPNSTNDLLAALTEFTWTPQPATAQLIQRLLNESLAGCSFAAELSQRMLNETGTRLVDWLDHFGLPDDDPVLLELSDVGYIRADRASGTVVWEHHQGLFPRIRVHDGVSRQLAIKVESVVDFLGAHGLTGIVVEGPPLASLREATVAREN